MRPRLLQTLLGVVLSFGFSFLLHAHMDQIIELKGTTLIGLPKDYAPAELEMTAFRLRIGKHEMTFSPYLQNLFEQPHDLRIYASWKGNLTLPPYIYLHIQPKEKDYSYELVFNLGTLDVIELSVVLKKSGSKTWTLPIALNDRIRKEIRESIRTVK